MGSSGARKNRREETVDLIQIETKMSSHHRRKLRGEACAEVGKKREKEGFVGGGGGNNLVEKKREGSKE